MHELADCWGGRLLGVRVASCWQEFTLPLVLLVVLPLTSSLSGGPTPIPPSPYVNSTDLGSSYIRWWFFLFLARKLECPRCCYLNVLWVPSCHNIMVQVCKGKLLFLYLRHCLQAEGGIQVPLLSVTLWIALALTSLVQESRDLKTLFLPRPPGLTAAPQQTLI